MAEYIFPPSPSHQHSRLQLGYRGISLKQRNCDFGSGSSPKTRMREGKEVRHAPCIRVRNGMRRGSKNGIDVDCACAFFFG